MAQYHALIAGLPNLSIELGRAPYTQEEFYTELLEVLSGKDRERLDWLRLEQVNREFLALFRSGALAPRTEDEESEAEELAHITLPISELRHISTQASLGNRLRRSETVPSYMIRFLNEQYYQAPEGSEEEETSVPSSLLSDEDRLAQLYFASASGCKNAFLEDWFRFNQTLRNVLLVYTCRQLDWDPKHYIVGDSPIEEALLTSKAKDFGLGEEIPYMAQLIHIAEEKDIAKRERLIDVLRWQWLEEHTEWTVFDIENVLSYYLRLGIIERWQRLDEEKGKAIFRDIVMNLKQESNKSLQDFRAKTKKR